MKPQLRRPVLAVLALVGTFPLAAQTSTPGTAPPPPPEEQQVVHLSPFEVSTSKDVGYTATETLAGTRIRTSIGDIGASIQVITPEFLNDIGATNTGSLLQYTTNAEVSGTLGTYTGLGNTQTVDETTNLRNPQNAQRSRGLAPFDIARDYYTSDIPWDSFNVDRIDILRGPNSFLYGLGSPAGIVNASTKNAEFRNAGELQARTGSYGSVRGSLDLNQQIIDNVLAIRVIGLADDEKYEQQPAFQHDRRIYGALRFDPQLFKNPAFHTSIKVKVENGRINANRPRVVPPYDSISPWYRPVAVSATNPFSGMGRAVATNPYDVWRTDMANIPPGYNGSSFGMIQQSLPTFQPYMSDQVNAQQPYWAFDGVTNQFYGATGGWIQNAGRDSNGNILSASAGLGGKRTNANLLGIGTVNGAMTAWMNAHNSQNSNNDPNLPFYDPFAGTDQSIVNAAKYGQYKAMSLTDPSIFNFYKTLIDGPTKSEFERWNAYNLDLQQTALNDRVGVEFTYDRQKYTRGGEALLPYTPTLSIDVTQNLPDYYVNPGTGGVSNPNFGRPFVVGNTAINAGTSFHSDHESRRISLFGELRASDFLSNDFLVKLLGKHEFNLVAVDDKYFTENRQWQLYANSQAWDGFWNATSGNSHSFADRQPTAVIYLGSSIINRSSPSGANLPGVAAPVTLPSTGVHVFNSTWQNYGVAFNAPWNVPASLNQVYNGLPVTGSTTQLYQASNPANYVGWSDFQDNLLTDINGDNTLLTLAQQQLRETISYSGSYQGHFWNNALVGTFGWRYDQVKTKNATAQVLPLERNALDLQPSDYTINGGYKHGNITKGHSTSGGVVLHLNNLLPHDFLPINVGLSYNESSNFQVTSQRVDLYNNPISNPSGKTREYGVTLSTKDGRYSFRAVRYDTRILNGTSTITNGGTIGTVIQQGLKWRNVFLYQLGVYDWSTRSNTAIYRNTWTNGFPLGSPNSMHPTTNETAQMAIDEENSAINTWDNIQNHLAALGFFKAWNFAPTDVLPPGPTPYTTFWTANNNDVQNPTQYVPSPASVTTYRAVTPQGFSVTADTESKGDEFELTANPTDNWRLSFNAAKTEATQKNIGGRSLSDFINYLTPLLINADGTYTPAGAMTQFGNPAFSIYPNIWAPFIGNYTALKLQEGSAVPEIRKWTYNFVTDYQFNKGFLSDYLKGVGVGGAYRWQDKVVIGYPVKNVAGSTIPVYDLAHPTYGPTEGYVDLWVSYARKLTDKINWKIQLNVRNVGAKNGLIPVTVEPDGKTWATVRVKPVQEWFVTNTFSF